MDSAAELRWALWVLAGAIRRREDQLRNGSQTAAVSIIAKANEIWNSFSLGDHEAETHEAGYLRVSQPRLDFAQAAPSRSMRICCTSTAGNQIPPVKRGGEPKSRRQLTRLTRPLRSMRKAKFLIEAAKG